MCLLNAKISYKVLKSKYDKDVLKYFKYGIKQIAQFVF